MKKLKKDTINYSKIYPKFKIIPILSVVFVVAYCSLPFIKLLNFDGGAHSAIDLFKQSSWIFGVYFIIPQAIVVLSFAYALFTSVKNKSFVAIDLSATVGALFGVLALYSVVFMAMTKMIDGAAEYIQWMIFMPILYLALTTIANFVCCFLSGKAKLPITILIYHCVCSALYIILAAIVASTPFVQMGEESYGVFVNGKLLILNETFVVTLGEAPTLLLVWAVTGLVAVVLTNFIEQISNIVQMYKAALLFKNDDMLEYVFKDDHPDWKDYVQTTRGKLVIEGAVLQNCREELSIKNGIILAIVGFVVLIARTGVLSGVGGDELQVYLSLLNDIPSAVCWATLLVGVAFIVITIVTKKITYKRMVRIEELRDEQDGKTVSEQKEN